MKHALGWAAHALCLASVLLSIWLPFGGRGQWIATALVLLLLGSALLGSAEKRDAVPTPEAEPEERARPVSGRPRPTYGTTSEEEDPR